jgi:Fic family protein
MKQMSELLNKIDANQAKLNLLRPFEGEILCQIRDYYKIGLTYSSNALEGNSLTESETKVLLEDGLTVGGKPLRDYYEATGHAAAFEYLFTLGKEHPLTESMIRDLHRLFYRLIDPIQAGTYRQTPVIITGSHYPTPSAQMIPTLMQELQSWLQKAEPDLHPVEFAALAHKQFVFIHPFIDGNGRVARLLMNLCLLRNGFTPVIIPPILRGEYISLLEKAHTQDRPFIRFIAECVNESQRELLRLLADESVPRL